MSSGPLKEWFNEATSANATVMERAGLCLVAVSTCPHASMRVMHDTFIKPCCAELHFAVSLFCARSAPLSSALGKPSAHASVHSPTVEAFTVHMLFPIYSLLPNLDRSQYSPLSYHQQKSVVSFHLPLSTKVKS